MTSNYSCNIFPNESQTPMVIGLANTIDFFQKSGIIKFKIKDSRHKVKAEAEAFASVSIGQREDFKAFNKSEGMLNNNALFALEPVLMFLFGSKFFQL